MTDTGAGSGPRTSKDATLRRRTPIVPQQSVAGRALIIVIAIMTFLSCLTLGAVTLVRDTAAVWQTQIAREATIQIKPDDDFDIEQALVEARDVAAGFAGVRYATIVDREATARLLEPWLGAGLDIDELPVPRLVIVTIDESAPPDFAAMRSSLQAAVENVSLDDHRNWVDRLITMARTTVTIGLAVLVLMLSATIMTVVFATRGAMAGNEPVIEVLHFVGAESRFIAAEFRRHFLWIGLQGAAVGGLAAVIVFVGFGWWSSMNLATPEADQATALFGNFAIGATGYAGVVIVLAIVAALTAATSHATVVSRLNQIEIGRTDHG